MLATLLAGATLVCSNAVDAGETLDLLEAEKPTMTNGFVAGIAHLARHPSFAAARPVVDAARQPVPDHGAGRAAGRPRAAAQHARHDRSGQRAADQRRRNRSTRAPARLVRQAGAGLRDQIIDTDDPATASSASAGRIVMQRYYGRSREECFDADGWFHTGDLVRTDADGFVTSSAGADR